jgi:hypothetical protein
LIPILLLMASGVFGPFLALGCFLALAPREVTCRFRDGRLASKCREARALRLGTGSRPTGGLLRPSRFDALFSEMRDRGLIGKGSTLLENDRLDDEEKLLG